MTTIQIYRTPHDVRAGLNELRRSGKTRIGFVPTMGALHDGHIALGTTAREHTDAVIYSIFVNPMQFAPHEDFGRYPRTLEADLEKLEKAGIDAVYTPDVETMYPKDFLTKVHVSGVSEPLEGEFRPQFFDGVATVVTKLLMQVGPDIAFFGEKDYQQLQVIRRLVGDLNLPLEVSGVPTVRDEYGLALSSRNAYLTADQLMIARQLNVILSDMGRKLREGKEIPALEADARNRLIRSGFGKVDYCTIRDAETLQFPSHNDPGRMRILAAAWLEKTRLIDNMAV